MVDLSVLLLVFSFGLMLWGKYKVLEKRNLIIEDKLDTILQHLDVKWVDVSERERIEALISKLYLEGDIDSAQKLERSILKTKKQNLTTIVAKT